MSQLAYQQGYRPAADRLYLPAQADARPYSRAAEWYLLFCLVLIMIEGVFTNLVVETLGSKEGIVARLTGYALWPTEIYFLSIGFLIGLGIFLAGRSQGRPVLGLWGFIAVWGVHLMAMSHAILRGSPLWHVDLRGMILPSIVVPWVAVLGKHVRLEVVFSRLIKIAVVLAVVNMARGLAFMSAGVQVTRVWQDKATQEGIAYQADLVLLLAYTMVLSRMMARGVTKLLPVIIIAAGVFAPLNKISIAAFLFANIVVLALSASMVQGRRSARIGKSLLLATLVGVALAGVTGLLLSVNEGAGMRFLRQRVLKEGERRSAVDVSTGRFDLWKTAIGQWMEKPVIGWGLGTRIYSGKKSMWLVYHNQYFRYLVQMGLVGLLVVMIAFFAWLRRALRTLKWEASPELRWPRVGMISFVCAIAFSCLYSETLSAMSVAYVFWAAVALEAAAHSRLLRGDQQIMPAYAAR